MGQIRQSILKALHVKLVPLTLYVPIGIKLVILLETVHSFKYLIKI